MTMVDLPHHGESNLLHIPRFLLLQRRIPDPQGRGSTINIVTWLTLTMMCLTVLTKVFGSWKKRGLPDDSLFALAAMFCGVGQVIAVCNQVAAGLGDHYDELTDYRKEQFQKAGYTAEVLYVVTIIMGKSTTLCFLKRLSAGARAKQGARGPALLTGIWGLICLLVTIFQCSAPNLWEWLATDKCLSKPALGTAIGSYDIVTDVILITIPIYIFQTMPLMRTKKIGLFAVFCVRGFSIPLTLIRLYFLDLAYRIPTTSPSPDKSYNSLLDLPYNLYATVIATQVCISMAVIFACAPFLKPFIEQLHTGILAGDAEAPGHNHFSAASVLEKLKPTARTWHRDPGGQSPTNLRFAAPWNFKEIPPLPSSDTHVEHNYHTHIARSSAGTPNHQLQKPSHYISLASTADLTYGRSKKYPKLTLNTTTKTSSHTIATHKPRPIGTPPPPIGVIAKTTTTTIICSPASRLSSDASYASSLAATCSSSRSPGTLKLLPLLSECTIGGRGGDVDHADLHALQQYHDRMMTPLALPSPQLTPKVLEQPMRTRKFVTVERVMGEGKRKSLDKMRSQMDTSRSQGTGGSDKSAAGNYEGISTTGRVIPVAELEAGIAVDKVTENVWDGTEGVMVSMEGTRGSRCSSKRSISLCD